MASAQHGIVPSALKSMITMDSLRRICGVKASDDRILLRLCVGLNETPAGLAFCYRDFMRIWALREASL